MKYRLKKDLPFAKAGTEVIIDEQMESFLVKVDPKLFNMGWKSISPASGKERLISEGWIEEVKPREFYIVLGPLTRVVYSTRETAETSYQPLQDKEIIKVREVTDE